MRRQYSTVANHAMSAVSDETRDDTRETDRMSCLSCWYLNLCVCVNEVLLLQRTAAGPGERGPPLLTSAYGSRDSPYREARRPEATGRYTRARWRSTHTASAAAVPASSPPRSGGLSRYIIHPRPALGRSAHPCPHVPPRPVPHAPMSRQPTRRWPHTQ